MARRRKGSETRNPFLSSGIDRKFFIRHFDINIEKEYERLKDVGKIPVNKLRDQDSIIKAINEAANNARIANIIYLKARKERNLFRIKYHKKMRRLTRIAIARLQSWLDATENVRKQITQDMVKEEIAANKDTLEDYEKLIQEEEDIREIRDNLKNLAEQWNERKGLLQTQARFISNM